MLYLERTINVNKGQATIDETVILYQGDKNVEIQFRITNNPFKSKANVDPTFGQLIIVRDKAEPIFSNVSRLSNNRIIFVIDGEMIDEASEIGFYKFQIRLFNEDKTSRCTLPVIENGIEIREPICDDEVPVEPAMTDIAVIDEAYINEDGQEENVFDENGNYNITTWSSGMVISSGKLNKMENAIGSVNGRAMNIQMYYATTDYVMNNYYEKNDANNTFATKDDIGNINDILDSINGEVI